MKKIILGFACMFTFATASLAQNAPPSKEQMAAMRSKNLVQVEAAGKMAGLDEKQIGKLKGIIEEIYKKQDEIAKDTTLTPDARKQKLKDANAAKDWKVQNLLGDKLKEYGEARKKLNEEAAANKQQ